MFTNPQEIDLVFVGSGNGVQAASISAKVSAISAVDRVAVSNTRCTPRPPICLLFFVSLQRVTKFIKIQNITKI